jgi:hypothetical protein
MTKLDKNTLINKFLQIEQLAYRGRHLVEILNDDHKAKIISTCKHIRHDLEELEVYFGIDD